MSLGADRLLGITPTLRRQLVLAQFNGFTVSTTTYAEQIVTLNTGYHVINSADAIGFDKYMQFYSKAWVLHSSWKLTGVSNVASDGGFFVGCCVTTNSTSLGAPAALVENGLCSWQMVNINPDRFQMSGKVDHSKFLGKPIYLDDPQLFCTASAQPSQVVVLHFGSQSGGSSASGKVTYMVEVVLDVVFTDPIPFT